MKHKNQADSFANPINGERGISLCKYFGCKTENLKSEKRMSMSLGNSEENEAFMEKRGKKIFAGNKNCNMYSH